MQDDHDSPVLPLTQNPGLPLHESPPSAPDVQPIGVSSAVAPPPINTAAAAATTVFPRNVGGGSIPPLSPVSAGAAGGSHIISQPSFRRHHRKRSSTIYVQPRQAPETIAQEDAPLAPGLLRGVTTLAGAQLLAKLLAFVLNQLLIRMLGARELGVASQLDLLVGTALALSRDALRLASQRQSSQKSTTVSKYTTDGRVVIGTTEGNAQETVNLGWIACALGTSVVLALSFIIQWQGSWPSSALSVAAAAAITELIAEPCFLLIQQKLNLESRAKAESAGNTARVLVVAFTLLVLKLSPFLGFAIGHLSYALVLTIYYYSLNVSAARMGGYSLLPVQVWANQEQQKTLFVSASLRRASLELSAQQLVKFFLTEGDRLAVGLMTTLEEQGEYALAANYGSLLARMAFQPIEEALRGYFSRVLPKQEQAAQPMERSMDKIEEEYSPQSTVVPQSQQVSQRIRSRSRGTSLSNGSYAPIVALNAPGSGVPASPTIPPSPIAASPVIPAPLQTPLQTPLHAPVVPAFPTTTTNTSGGASVTDDKIMILTNVLRAYSYLGILAAGFGPLVAGYVLSFVVSSARFGNAPQVLAAYACYIPVMAWNGVIEALVQSVASLHTLRVQGAVLAGIAGLFIVLTYTFNSVAKLGAVGIVWAQIITMTLRAAWNLQFATKYFARGYRWLGDCLPAWWIGIAAAVSVGTAHYAIGAVTNFGQFAAVVALAGALLALALASEYKTLLTLKNNISRSSEKPSHKIKMD